MPERRLGLLDLDEETIVSRGAFPELHMVLDPASANQAVSGVGCRPTRAWVMSALRRHFGHAYTTTDQPDYPDFVTDWGLIGHPGNLRAVFVGARQALSLPTLTDKLPMRHRNAAPRPVELAPRLDPASDDMAKVGPLAELATENARLRAQIKELQRSNSWRLTAPLRWLVNLTRD